MHSKTAYAGAWLVVTALAAFVAWRSLDFVNADTAGGPTISAAVPSTSTEVVPVPSDVVPELPASVVEEVEGQGSAASSDGASVEGRAETSAVEPTQLVFELTGGWVSISFSPERVYVVWATPSDGFGVKTETDNGVVDVEFDNDQVSSKLVAWWDGGPRYSFEDTADG